MPPSTAMREVASDHQSRYVGSILNRLQEDADFKDLSSHASAIESALSALTTAVQQRDALYVPHSQASVDRRHAIDDARRVYRSTYHQLQLMFPGQASLVESFFWRSGKSTNEANPGNETTTVA